MCRAVHLRSHHSGRRIHQRTVPWMCPYWNNKGLFFIDLSQAEEDMSCYSRVAKFLLACLTRIPTRTCQALLKQVSRTALPVLDYRIKWHAFGYFWGGRSHRSTVKEQTLGADVNKLIPWLHKEAHQELNLPGLIFQNRPRLFQIQSVLFIICAFRLNTRLVGV